MFEKDLMQNIADELDALGPEEKERRRQSLQRLLEAELHKRQQQPASSQPVKKKSWFSFFFNS